MAREADPTLPIAGMPIINVDEAQSVIVVKRSLSPGFAGIPNPLFVADNTLMLFGDGRDMIQALVARPEGVLGHVCKAAVLAHKRVRR